MEEYKQEFEAEYNNALDFYKRSDYKSFFKFIRNCIECVGKILICDIANDEELAEGLIQGELDIVKSRDTGNLEIIMKSEIAIPEGKHIYVVLNNIFRFRNPSYYAPNVPNSQKTIKLHMEAFCSEFKRFYDIASECGSHTGKPRIDPTVHAPSYMAFFYSFIDSIKNYKIASNETVGFFESFEKVSIGTSLSEEVKQDILSLIEKSKQQEAKLLVAEALRLEAEKEVLKQKNINANLNEQILQLQRQIEENSRQLAGNGVRITDFSEEGDNGIEEKEDRVQPAIKPRLRLLETLRTPASEMVVDTDSMDDDQLDIIDKNISDSMIVTGCAGSGKSVIAMYKAEQIALAGGDVILIAYTKSLSAFMREGIQKKTLPYRFFYHFQWEKAGMPSADYIIVDEIQDFTVDEISAFMKAAKKCFLFFGDTAQSIYTNYKKDTVSIEQLSKMTGIAPLYLYNNYRLPRAVAKITQNYVGVNVEPYSEKVYQNPDKSIPYIVKLDSFEKQMDVIANIADVSSSDLFIKKSVGILVPSNEMVMDVCNALQKRDFDCEYKYTRETTYGQELINTLDFSTRYPKVMTYHSAKGLQFDVVILPMYEGAFDEEDRKALYVAMTRTMGELYILYSTDQIHEPLDKVKSNLYKKSLPK